MDHVVPAGDQARMAETLLHSTVSPTVVRAGDKTNVIPGEAVALLDGRLLPGQTPEDLLHELRAITGDLLDYEVTYHAEGMVNHPPDSPLWDAICRSIGQHTGGLPVFPFMNPGVSDAHQFARLGARWYGFTPLWVDPHGDFRVAGLYHNYDERIPEDGFHWGLRVLYDVVLQYCS
jgi:acetylornithine deacetylase/succinyl-diaminopimelate desuccinylase-like protein